MPTKQVTEPMSGETKRRREKLLVVIRADAAGITSNAEINNVPITRIVTRIVNEIITNRTPSTSETEHC